MVTREEFKEYARKKAKELNLSEQDVLPTAEAFYKSYNELADEIQGKEMDDVLNVIIRELAIRPPMVVIDKESHTFLKHLLSEPRLWRRRLL